MPKQQTPKLRWSKSEKGSLIGKARVSKNMVVEYVCTNESKDKTKQEWTHMRLIGYREDGWPHIKCEFELEGGRNAQTRTSSTRLCQQDLCKLLKQRRHHNIKR